MQASHASIHQAIEARSREEAVRDEFPSEEAMSRLEQALALREQKLADQRPVLRQRLEALVARCEDEQVAALDAAPNLIEELLGAVAPWQTDQDPSAVSAREAAVRALRARQEAVESRESAAQTREEASREITNKLLELEVRVEQLCAEAAIADEKARSAKLAPDPAPAPALDPAGAHAKVSALERSIDATPAAEPCDPEAAPGQGEPDGVESATEEAGASRRAAPRVELSLGVGLTTENNFYDGFSENLSVTGIFVATYDLLPIGTTIQLRFSLPNEEEIETDAVVRWLREPQSKADPTWPGMGLEFVDLGPEAAQSVQHFVERREPLFFPG